MRGELFPTRAEKARPQKRQVSEETLRYMGIRAVADMNPRARSPNLSPTGSTRPLVLALGTAPDRDEDEDGKHGAGVAGRYLKGMIPRRPKDRVRWDHVCRTRPPGDRDPKRYEIEAYRDLVTQDIQETKPRVVLALGRFAIQWALGFDVTKATTFRGKRFKTRIGTHTCWVCPTVDPAWVLDNRDTKPEKVPGEEWAKFFKLDVRAAFKLADEGSVPEVLPRRQYEDGVVLAEKGWGAGAICRAMEELAAEAAGGPITFDLETNALRPYGKGAQIVSVSLSSGPSTFAFGVAHPSQGFEGEDLQRIQDVFRGILGQSSRVYAHNLGFDLEWLIWWLGPEIVGESSWHDTMIQGYVLDERAGAISLNVLAAQHLGLPMKSLTPDDVSLAVKHSRAAEVRLERLLRYNALDARFTALLGDLLQEEIEREGLEDVYRLAVKRVPTVTLMQWFGLPVCQETRRRFQGEYGEKAKEAADAVRTHRSVKEFERKHGRFNVASSQHVAILFRDVCSRREGITQSATGYSTAEDVLKQIARGGAGAEVAESILEYRRVTKLLGTYVEPMRPGHRKSVIWPDGKLHTHYSTAFARTGRLSSSEPNLQNLPARANKQIRAMVVAEVA